jgi:hypothetical protein
MNIWQKIVKYYEKVEAETRVKQENLQIDVRAYNAFGEIMEIDFKDTISFKLTPNFFFIRIELKDIESTVYPGTSLGSLLLADSLVLQEGCYLLLTKQIPYIDLWTYDNLYSEKIESMKKRINFPQWGK